MRGSYWPSPSTWNTQAISSKRTCWVSSPRSSNEGSALRRPDSGTADTDRSASGKPAHGRLSVHESKRACPLAGEKEVLRNLESRAADSHFDRLREGHLDTAKTSSLHFDALRDLKNNNTNLVTAAAHPVLESKGELLRSHFRQDDNGSLMAIAAAPAVSGWGCRSSLNPAHL